MDYINRPDELARLMQEYPDLPVIPVVTRDSAFFAMPNGDAFFVPTISDVKVQKYVLLGSEDRNMEIHFEEEYKDLEEVKEIKWTGSAITMLLSECA